MNNEKFKIYSIEEVINEIENCEYIDCTKGSGYFDNNQYENILYYLKQYQISQERINKAIENIENGDLLYLASKCSIIYKDNIEVVAIYDRLKELLKILKGE